MNILQVQHKPPGVLEYERAGSKRACSKGFQDKAFFLAQQLHLFQRRVEIIDVFILKRSSMVISRFSFIAGSFGYDNVYNAKQSISTSAVLVRNPVFFSVSAETSTRILYLFIVSCLCGEESILFPGIPGYFFRGNEWGQLTFSFREEVSCPL